MKSHGGALDKEVKKVKPARGRASGGGPMGAKARASTPSPHALRLLVRVEGSGAACGCEGRRGGRTAVDLCGGSSSQTSVSARPGITKFAFVIVTVFFQAHLDAQPRAWRRTSHSPRARGQDAEGQERHDLARPGGKEERAHD